MKDLLNHIYGEEAGKQAFARLQSFLGAYPTKKSEHQQLFSEKNVILITYGDTLKGVDHDPLAELNRFSMRYFKEVFSTIHILPFYPYSTDDGFSVMDFYKVDEALGDWSHIDELGSQFSLMFDFVLNHISAQSDWFKRYLSEETGYNNLAIEVDPDKDLSRVTRPRSLPLLTEFEKTSGEKVHVWTTFSEDQVDLNFASIEVLEKMVEILLFYVERGASILRLDAVAYLWKEIGTSCIHLPKTHDMVKLFRLILDRVAPHVMILTETNVPHAENVSYFGNGEDEAQMVYNFTLPPLLIHSLIKADATALSAWAKGLQLDAEHNTFFNFTASHDGIGVRPLEGILTGAEIDFLVNWVSRNGGRVSYKKNPDGSESPYELNITYIDAFLDNRIQDDSLHIHRFLASQAIQFCLPGIPAVYMHSILGSRNWQAGVKQTGRARSINRQKLDSDVVSAALADPSSFRSRIFHPYVALITTRRNQPAFHPNAAFEIIDLGTRVFAVKRSCPSQEITAITNISPQRVTVTLQSLKSDGSLVDLLTGRIHQADSIQLGPYEYLWLHDK